MTCDILLKWCAANVKAITQLKTATAKASNVTFAKPAAVNLPVTSYLSKTKSVSR